MDILTKTYISTIPVHVYKTNDVICLYNSVPTMRHHHPGGQSRLLQLLRFLIQLHSSRYVSIDKKRNEIGKKNKRNN